jgi:hypothetical protein
MAENRVDELQVSCIAESHNGKTECDEMATGILVDSRHSFSKAW